MFWIDGHLDLAFLALTGRDLRSAVEDADTGCVSLPALRAANINLVFATIFTEPNRASNEPWCYPSSDDLDAAEAAGLQQLEVYEQLEAEGQLAIVRSGSDLEHDDAALKVVILMEGADPIRSARHLAQWHNRGVRMIGLTWAMGTRYAGGNAMAAHGPLTEAGRELVHAMDELHIIHDASHLADEALDELLNIARGPIVATHSNCRALAGNQQRHLRDDQITRIGERGGVIGLNLFSDFITPTGKATIAQAIDHVEHICSVLGHRRGVALGSDMDGGFAPRDLPENIRPETIHRLADQLMQRGWDEADIHGFAYGNWLRLLRSAL